MGNGYPVPVSDPKPSNLVLVAIGAAFAGAGAALAVNAGFRRKVLGSAKALGKEIAGDG
jgi:hypothetical protein